MGKKHKFDYFNAYEKLTALAVDEADCLIQALDEYGQEGALVNAMEKVHELEHRGDSINHDIFQSAALDFMPPIDREDIVELARALDDVLDCIDDVIKHMYMYDVHTVPEDAHKFASFIKGAAKALDKAMAEFRNFKKSKKFRHLIVDINSYEEEADELYKNVIHHLHTVENEHVMHVLVWSRIYERMEKCCDACEHSADIMSTIMLKNL